MPFNEKIKLEVKRKAAFRCCRCHEIGIEIHHILPQAFGGEDNIENAGPLCSNCHTNFGANPEKRKELRQMRDWWYEVVIEKYHDGEDKWRVTNDLIIEVQNGNDRKLEELKQNLNKMQSDIVQIKDTALGSIQHKTNEYITATTLGNNIHANFQCKKCGTAIGLLIGSNHFPQCKTPIG